MSQQERNAGAKRPSGRRQIAGLIALVAFVALGAFWFLALREAREFGSQQAMAVGLVVVACTAAVAAIRDMSVVDILEWVWEAILGLLSTIGGFFRGLFGLD